MRGLTTRSVRPCLRHTAHSSTHLSVRRTILPPTRKGLTAADAFAILLPSVLTAAFVFDATAKKERSLEWDRQIAAVEQETEAINQRQLEAWSRIQKRSVARGAMLQRRAMSTSARAIQVDELSDEVDPFDIADEINRADGDITSNPVPTCTPEQAEAQCRYERLIATRLALQMILQIRTARTNVFNPNKRVSVAQMDYNTSMDYLVAELERLAGLIQDMRNEHVPYGAAIPKEHLARKLELGSRLDEATSRFARGDLHLPDYVMSYLQLVGEYKLGPPVETYCTMLRAFTIYSKQSAMAVMVENALWDCNQHLKSFAIANILWRHGTDMDALRMTEFLSRISQVDASPRPEMPWIRSYVNDMRIMIPKSKNPFLICGLIRAALANRQTTLGEAYASVFIDRYSTANYTGKFKWYVISSFLQSCGVWGSWNSGKRWLQLAISWAEDLYEASDEILGRVILRMLDTCVACDREQEYHLILSAAIASQIHPPPIELTKPAWFSERMSQIRLDWVSRVNESELSGGAFKAPQLEHVKHFQSLLDKKFDPDQDMPQAKPFLPTESTWREHVKTYIEVSVLNNSTSTDSTLQDVQHRGQSTIKALAEYVEESDKISPSQASTEWAQEKADNDNYDKVTAPEYPTSKEDGLNDTQRIQHGDQDEAYFQSPLFPRQVTPRHKQSSFQTSLSAQSIPSFSESRSSVSESNMRYSTSAKRLAKTNWVPFVT